jgi:hypothetical protein
MSSDTAEPDVARSDEDADDVDYPSAEAALNAALAAAQGAFPPIPKNRTGEVKGKTKDGTPYSYSYSYADLADVLAAVRPVLSENGLAIAQRTNRAGILRTELRHVAGGVLDTEVELGQSPSNPQQFGGALTYLRRYELTTLLGVAAEEDRDARDVEPPSNGRAPAELPPWAHPATDEQKRKLLDALEPIIGGQAARALGAGMAASIGRVPAIAVPIARAIRDAYLAQAPDAVAERHAAAREAAQAAEERARQDAAAEQPDAEPDEDPPPGVGAPLDEEVDAEPVDPPSAEDLAETAAGAEAPDAPAPGTVEVAPRADGEAPVKYVERLRAAGCVCRQPVLGIDAPQDVDTNCPVKGHGIPF